MADSVVRVLLVDDEDIVRVGLRMVLGADPAIEVVGEAADGQQAVSAVVHQPPGSGADGHSGAPPGRPDPDGRLLGVAGIRRFPHRPRSGLHR